MSIPDSLTESIDLFRETGRFSREATEFFRPSSWLSMYAGFGILPNYYSPTVDDVTDAQLITEFTNMAQGIANAVQSAPTHGDFIKANCPAVLPAQLAGNARV
jgi:tryptophan halogenase